MIENEKANEKNRIAAAVPPNRSTIGPTTKASGGVVVVPAAFATCATALADVGERSSAKDDGGSASAPAAAVCA
jgi:hypothetical protein